MTTSGVDGSGDASQRESQGHGPGSAIGSFRYWFDSGQWEWSDEVAAMHGYRPGEMTPTTELLASHKHPDDRENFIKVVEQIRSTRTPLSSRHRMIDTHGRTRNVIVVGRTFQEDGRVVGAEGIYFDIDGAVDESIRGKVAVHVEKFKESRTVVEQAKGMLMLVYGIGEDRAFEVLRWLSQTRNVPIRGISRAIVTSSRAGTWVSEGSRRDFDTVLLDAAGSDAAQRR